MVSDSKVEVSAGGDGMVPEYAEGMGVMSVVETKEPFTYDVSEI